MSDRPSVNPDHIIIVLQKQRDLLFNSLTQAEIDKVALAERVAILEAQLKSEVPVPNVPEAAYSDEIPGAVRWATP